MRQHLNRFLAVIAAVFMSVSMFPAFQISAAESDATTTLTFSDSGISETVAGSGYSIKGTAVEISAAGTYKFTGSCSSGSISVKKNLKGVIIIFEDLSLTSDSTAPVIIKSSSEVTIHLNGTNTLTDAEDSANEDSDDFEGACIKAKTGSQVTFCGNGTLNVNGNAKNGIKGGTSCSLIFNAGTYNVNSANNAIASDGSITFNGGTFNVDSENDGIKSEPEADDTDSAGSITVNGGEFNITSEGDGFQAETLTINNGTFNITAFGGYENYSNFDEDTMSAKGIKASGERETTNEMTINGGTFTLNSADDAIHSDGNIAINAGTFTITTGDDGVHAENNLVLGTEDGLERDPDITVNACYEGLEGSYVTINSGRFYIIASDDGVNAAGGSSSGSTIRPGTRPSSQTSTNYSITINGGSLYINCDGDGIDSNGAIYLYGGTQTVLSMKANGDNSPLDAESTILIKGATVFGAGSQGQASNIGGGSSQGVYVSTGSSGTRPGGRPGSGSSGASTNYNAGTVINISNSTGVICSQKLTKNVSYIIYSDPTMTSSSSVSVSTATTLTSCKSNSWAHNWDNGTVTTQATADEPGVITYVCKDCQAVERQSIFYASAITCDGHEVAESTDTAKIETVDFGGNYKLAKYTPETTVSTGKTVMYGDQEMYSKNGCWYCVIANGVTPSLSDVTIVDGTATAYEDIAKGDINGNDAINITDAQIAYDIANLVYSGFEQLSAADVLKADVNNDMVINAADARAIQVYVHTGSFTS